MISFTSVCFAHISGHNSKITGRKWTFIKDGETHAFFGSFYLYKDGVVTIENGQHELFKIPIHQLSKADYEVAIMKAKHIAILNHDKLAVNTLSESAPKQGNISLNINLEVVVMVIILLGICFVFFAISRKKLYKFLKTILILFMGLAMLSSCKKNGCTDETADNYDNNAKTDDGTCTYTDIMDVEEIDASFTPYSNVSTYFDENYFYVESNGIPNHDDMMVGITAWIAQVPLPHDYTGADAWPIPLNPEYADSPVSIEGHLQKGAIAIAANGIPIFNPINASGDISKEIGELDAYGGHSGRGDDYHYHAAPLHLEATSGANPIAFGLDGYAVYGSTEPDGSTMEDLDEYHGPEWHGVCHYHGTETYPYMIAGLRGKITLAGTAPEDQITPQPVGQALRGDPHPINTENLIITSCVENSTDNGYTLTYEINGVEGSVIYSWDQNDLFTFTFNDVDGSVTTETFQR